MSDVFKSDAKLRGYIVSAMRRIWSWSRERSRAVSRAKVGRSMYQCEKCKVIKKWSKNFDVDHIKPIGPSPYSRNDKDLRGWDDWLNALFCSADNLQVLCKECHKGKTYKKTASKKEGA